MITSSLSKYLQHLNRHILPFHARTFTAKFKKEYDGVYKRIYHLPSENAPLSESLLEAVFNRPKSLNAIGIETQIMLN